jgi:chromosomal replication initiator protein
MNLQDFWNETLSQLKSDMDEGEFSFVFSSLQFESSSGNSITLSVPSAFFRKQLEGKYLAVLEEKLFDLTGQKIEFSFSLRKPEPAPKAKPIETVRDVLSEPSKPTKAAPRKAHIQLNPDYTLENYVVGKNNEFAYSCAVSISKDPGNAYNPFFLYGGVGLGKTHLIQALGNAIHRNNEKAVVTYLPAESFVNEFLGSLQNKTQSAFKNKYRNVDVLLIDDIHDLQNKKDTQEELFNTFNALYEAKKQIVFTSDRPPQELKAFAERLLSRLTRGIIADLQLPTWETRLVILRTKMESWGIKLSDAVLELVAKNVSTNIRDLEAALKKISAYGELLNREITLEVAQEQLKSAFAGPAQQNIAIDLVQRVVAEAHNLSVADLKGKKRTQAITLPRQIAMFLIRELTEYSTTEVGMEFGGRDHTTVMHAVQKIEDKMRTEPSFEIKIQNLVRTVRDRAGN